MVIGTTYSHRHAMYLRLDPNKSFEELLDFGFDAVRLGCYWDEIENRKGTYTFSAIKKLLEKCEEHGQKVLLTIGMKAPRWPEYYFPRWLDDATPEGSERYIASYLEKTVEALQKYSCITHWQVENEPLDPSGAKELSIPLSLLEKEIQLVRKLDTRPILVNLWGNELKKRKLLPLVENLADVIGLDIYYKVPIIGPIYSGPKESDKQLAELIKNCERPIWITELQAEPWEQNFLVPRAATPSMNEALLKKNFFRARALSAEAIFLWGFEYWLMQKKEGDMRLWNAAKEIMIENQ